MKVGDMVKFRDITNHSTEELSDWKIGLLVEYQAWYKTATVLHNGEVRRLPGRIVYKAGKKDYESR